MTRVGRAVAPWRWPLWCVVVIAEAFWADGLAADINMFSARGGDILSGHLSAVYADSLNQAGPVQLVMNWLLLRGGSGGDIPVFTLATVNVGLLALALLACRSRSGADRSRSAGREAAVGALLAVWLMPDGLWGGHPAEIAIPILWVVAATLASRGRGLGAGVLIGLATAVAPWGILALPIGLLSTNRRSALATGLAGILVSGAAYLPFVLTGRFLLFHHRWPVYPGSLIHLVAPGITEFGWDLRAGQATLAMAACAFIAVRRRDVDGIWLAALAPALVRVVSDPVVGIYYWQPIGAVIIAGIALGAPTVKSPQTWTALVVLAYLPYLANSRGMWVIAGAGCLTAAVVLTVRESDQLRFQ